MRAIRFKGKCIQDDSWVFGDVCRVTHYIAIKPFSDSYRSLLIDPRSLCQFIGFTDKNGKEIYEGDVLRSDEYPYSCIGDKKRDNYYAVVYYCEEGACFGTVTAKNPSSDVRGISDGILDDVEREKMKNFEVVGNIHEPEWKQYGEYFQEIEERR